MAHVKRTIRIDAALEEVCALARDPHRWDRWFVGWSDTEALVSNGHRRTYLAVGVRFPLTQPAVEDQVEGVVHWRAKAQGPTECISLGSSFEQLLIACNQDWTYAAKGNETEVEVDLDLEPGQRAEPARSPADAATVERLQAQCLERSLANLKSLCEAA